MPIDRAEPGAAETVPAGWPAGAVCRQVAARIPLARLPQGAALPGATPLEGPARCSSLKAAALFDTPGKVRYALPFCICNSRSDASIVPACTAAAAAAV